MSEYKYLNELRTEELIDEVKRRLGVRLIVVNEMPESAPDGSARLYMGETTADYTKGHIYQYIESVWNDVTEAVEVIKDVTVFPEGDEIKNIFYNLGADTWTGWNLEVNFDVHPDVIPYPTVPLTKAQFDTIGWVGYNGFSSARNSSLTFFADTKNPDAVKLGWFDGADIVELYAVQYISSYDTQNNAKTRIRLFDTYENYQSNTDIHTYEYIHSDVDDKTTFTELRKWESSGIYAGNDTNDKLIRLANSTDEVDTGKRWIDGKKIYRKVIPVPNVGSISSGGTKIVSFSRTANNIKDVTFAQCLMKNSAGYDYPNFAQVMAVDGDGIRLQWLSGGALTTGNVIIEYTKTT